MARQEAHESGVSGITFDTGALIGLERHAQRISHRYKTALADGVWVTVPSVVIAEWWHGRTDVRERILGAVRIEQTDTALMKTAGQAMAVVRGAMIVDTIVMASAARRGDVVYTSDFDDLDRLTTFFKSVRVLRC